MRLPSRGVACARKTRQAVRLVGFVVVVATWTVGTGGRRYVGSVRTCCAPLAHFAMQEKEKEEKQHGLGQVVATNETNFFVGKEFNSSGVST